MNKDKYILSICIPTFNRRDILKELLINLVTQIENLECKVQLCISDNNSVDSTNGLLSYYSGKYNFVKINSNSHNYGYDYNLCRVIDMADGKYIWTFSDDDIILNNGILEITKLIEMYEGNNLSVIYAQPKFVQKDIIINDSKLSIIDQNIENKVYNDYNSFLYDISWIITFVSSFIFKAEFIPDNLSEFIGSGFIHTPIILSAAKMGDISIATGKTIILSRQSNSGGYNIYKYFGTNIASVFEYFGKHGYSKKILRKVETEWLEICVRGNVINYKLGNNSKFDKNNKIRDLFIPYKTNIFFIFKILPILLLPKNMFILIYNWRKISHERTK